jgi:WD40 repeat protein
VWDAQSGNEILTLKPTSGFAFGPPGKRGPSGPGPGSGGSNVTFSPDGKRIASIAQPGVKVWDAQTGEELFACKAPAGSPAAFASQARNVVFSPDGKRLACPYGDNTVKVWDAQTGEELLTFKGHSDRVYSIAYSADGKRMASGSDDKTVRIWDAQTGVELLSHTGHDGRVNCVAFSPDGHHLASASGSTVRIYDATPLPEKP